jgi:small subunit ribosomal protein S5
MVSKEYLFDRHIYMSEENKTTEEVKPTSVSGDAAKSAPSAPVSSKSSASASNKPGGNDSRGRGGGGGGRGRRPSRRPREPREFEQTILDLARVTRVTKGGKRMRFRVALVIGDKKGRVGFGVAKGADVQLAIEKAYHQAKRNVINLDLVNGSFPHRQIASFRAADVLLMPAPDGTGLKAGGAIRTILELGGVQDAVGKILRGKNKMNVAKATFKAIELMMVPEGVDSDKSKMANERKSARESASKKVAKKIA